MTIAEIKSVLPPVAVWMAKGAVMEGVKSHHKAERERNIQEAIKLSGETYDFTLSHAYGEGVSVSASILWKLFASCSNECQQAIARVAQTRDGYCGMHECYFDDFVNALEIVQGHSVHIRVAE